MPPSVWTLSVRWRERRDRIWYSCVAWKVANVAHFQPKILKGIADASPWMLCAFIEKAVGKISEGLFSHEQLLIPFSRGASRELLLYFMQIS